MVKAVVAGAVRHLVHLLTFGVNQALKSGIVVQTELGNYLRVGLGALVGAAGGRGTNQRAQQYESGANAHKREVHILIKS
jgi:hypothetical protein